MTIERDRVALYCRISSDREGAGLGIARQEKECRELAQRIGWDITIVFSDNDISALSGKYRPGYAALCDAIKVDQLDGLIVWHTDRLHRNVRELLDFLDLVKNKDFPVRTVQAGQVDLTTPTGRALAVTFGAWAQQESEHKAERIRSKARELAEDGKLSGGGTRPFGYEADRLTVRESEANLLVQATRGILHNGMTIHGICRDWNERGIPTINGGRWVAHALRRMLMSARISGRREHHGVIVSQAVWQPIISAEESDRLRELLGDPVRTTYHGDHARKYLLTGFLWCGLDGCGRKMIARAQGDHQPSYVCADIGMSHLRIIGEPLELYVREAAFDYLDEFIDLASAIRSGTDVDATREARLWAELRNYQTSLEDVESRFYVQRKMPEATFQRVSRELEASIRSVRTELNRVRQHTAMIDMPASSQAARAQWVDRTFSWRRLLIQVLVERVTIGPGVRGLNKFDDKRVKIKFKQPY